MKRVRFLVPNFPGVSTHGSDGGVADWMVGWTQDIWEYIGISAEDAAITWDCQWERDGERTPRMARMMSTRLRFEIIRRSINFCLFFYPTGRTPSQPSSNSFSPTDDSHRTYHPHSQTPPDDS